MRETKHLYQAILGLKEESELERFFADLCTPQELETLAERWEVARLLDRDIPYRQIYEDTGVSTATVTRVAKALRSGSGYRLVLDRLDRQERRGKKDA